MKRLKQLSFTKNQNLDNKKRQKKNISKKRKSSYKYFQILQDSTTNNITNAIKQNDVIRSTNQSTLILNNTNNSNHINNTIKNIQQIQQSKNQPLSKNISIQKNQRQNNDLALNTSKIQNIQKIISTPIKQKNEHINDSNLTHLLTNSTHQNAKKYDLTPNNSNPQSSDFLKKRKVVNIHQNNKYNQKSNNQNKQINRKSMQKYTYTPQPQYKSLLKSFNNQNGPQKLAQKALREQKYIYIDINQQKGFKVMQKCDPQDSDQQTQKFGRNYVTNLTGLSKQNQKINLYLSKIKQMTQKKQQIRTKIKQQLDKSQKKIDKIYKRKHRHSSNHNQYLNSKQKLDQSNNEFEQENNKLKFYRGMDSFKLKQYMQMRELQQLNSQIVQKQRKLVMKFGIIADYKSISVQQNERKKYPPNKMLSPINNQKNHKTIDYINGEHNYSHSHRHHGQHY